VVGDLQYQAAEVRLGWGRLTVGQERLLTRRLEVAREKNGHPARLEAENQAAVVLGAGGLVVRGGGRP
jgi:hypothetical protein